jgi:hypothetical protein
MTRCRHECACIHVGNLGIGGFLLPCRIETSLQQCGLFWCRSLHALSFQDRRELKTGANSKRTRIQNRCELDRHLSFSLGRIKSSTNRIEWRKGYGPLWGGEDLFFGGLHSAHVCIQHPRQTNKLGQRDLASCKGTRDPNISPALSVGLAQQWDICNLIKSVHTRHEQVVARTAQHRCGS